MVVDFSPWTVTERTGYLGLKFASQPLGIDSRDRLTSTGFFVRLTTSVSMVTSCPCPTVRSLYGMIRLKLSFDDGASFCPVLSVAFSAATADVPSEAEQSKNHENSTSIIRRRTRRRTKLISKTP